MTDPPQNSDSRTVEQRSGDRDRLELRAPKCPPHDTASADNSSVNQQPSRIRWFWWMLAAGTLIRIVTVPLSSPDFNLPFLDTYSWPMDHVTYVRWAEQATSPDTGLLSMYTRPHGEGLTIRLPAGREFVRVEKRGIANYPPLGLYLIWLQGEVLRRLDPQMIANTGVARAVFHAIPLIGDMVLAIGVWMLCLCVFDRRTAMIATTVVYLIPPIWLNSCWWGQTDSWEMAPMVWVVWAMVRHRWLTAGLLWGIGLSLKPRAILLAPVWLFIWMDIVAPRMCASRPKRAPGELGRVVVAVFLAMVVLNLTALPFWLTSGSAWFEQSYVENLHQERPETTVKAFNIWYLDLLRTYDTDATIPLAGLSKDSWGKILAVAGLALAFIIARRYQELRAHRVVVFSGLWLLVVVMVATRVHERYIVMCLPFLVIAAAAWRRFWPGVIALVVVACFQMTVYHWLNEPADAWTRKWLADTVNYHRHAVAQTPPELRHQLPSLEQATQMRFENFLREHTSLAPLEWGLSILACFATGFVFYRAWQTRHQSAYG